MIINALAFARYRTRRLYATVQGACTLLYKMLVRMLTRCLSKLNAWYSVVRENDYSPLQIHPDGAKDGVERLLDGREAAAMNAAEAACQLEVGTEVWGEMPIEAEQ